MLFSSDTRELLQIYTFIRTISKLSLVKKRLGSRRRRGGDTYRRGRSWEEGVKEEKERCKWWRMIKVLWIEFMTWSSFSFESSSDTVAVPLLLPPISALLTLFSFSTPNKTMFYFCWEETMNLDAFFLCAEGIPTIGMSPFSCGWTTSKRDVRPNWKTSFLFFTFTHLLG